MDITQVYKQALIILEEIQEDLLNNVDVVYHQSLINGFITTLSKDLSSETIYSDKIQNMYIDKYRSDMKQMSADQKIILYIPDSSITSLIRINNYINNQKKITIFECYSICKIQDYLCKTGDPHYKYSFDKIATHNFNALQRTNPFVSYIVSYHNRKQMKYFNLGPKYHCGHCHQPKNKIPFPLFTLPVSYLSFWVCNLLLK